MLRIVFIYAQIFGAFWKYLHALEILGSLRICFVQEFRVGFEGELFFWSLPTIPGALSHESQYVG